MNEGWATFWHYTLLNTMYDEGLLTDGFMMEFLQSHTNVVFQPPVTHPGYSGINPYALGFAMFTRPAPHLREPDRRRPRLVPRHRRQRLASRRSTTRCATSRTRASSASTCRRKLMREFRLFSILDDATQKELEVAAIHDDTGYRRLREVARTPVRPGLPRAQHPGVERQPARRPLADAAPHPPQRPAAGQRAGSGQARGAAVGLRVRLESVDGQDRVMQHRKVAGPGGLIRIPLTQAGGQRGSLSLRAPPAPARARRSPRRGR